MIFFVRGEGVWTEKDGCPPGGWRMKGWHARESFFFVIFHLSVNGDAFACETDPSWHVKLICLNSNVCNVCSLTPE